MKNTLASIHCIWLDASGVKKTTTMDNNNKKEKLPRRAFLETGITGGLGIALGLGASAMLQGDDPPPPEMIKMLTPEGQLVEVEKRRIPAMCGKPVPVSNQEIKEWMRKDGE